MRYAIRAFVLLVVSFQIGCEAAGKTGSHHRGIEAHAPILPSSASSQSSTPVQPFPPQGRLPPMYLPDAPSK